MVYFNSNQAISFRYTTYTRIADRVGRPDEARRAVICELVNVDASSGKPTTTVFATGESICHPRDNFSKDTGRRKALAKAIQNGIPRLGGVEFRKAIWDAYLNRPRGQVVDTTNYVTASGM